MTTASAMAAVDTCTPDSAWADIAPLPAPRSSFASVMVDGNLYVLGGYESATNQQTNTAFRYDIASDAWIILPPPPGQHGIETQAAVWRGKIYWISGSLSNNVSIYDIATNTWSAGADVPGLANQGVAGAFAGKVYVIGGGGGTNLRIYDIASNTWSTGPAAPRPVNYAGYRQVGQYLYVVGGYDYSTNSVRTDSFRLDMAYTPTYQTGPNFIGAHSGAGLAFLYGELYQVGGFDGMFTASSSVDAYPLGPWPGGTWAGSAFEPMPAAVANGAAFARRTATGGEMYTIGSQLDPTHSSAAARRRTCSVPKGRLYCSNLAAPQPIPDGTYNGTLASMLKVTIDVPLAETTSAESVALRVKLSHGYAGDLVMKLRHPDGSDTIALLSQPGKAEANDGAGGGGTSAGLSAGYPIVFGDDAATDSEVMGYASGLAGTDTICRDDGYCRFRPSAGAIALPANFRVFRNLDPRGTWELYVGDRDPFATGNVSEACIILDGDDDRLFYDGLEGVIAQP